MDNDRLPPEDYDAFLDSAFRNIVDALPGGGSIYLCGAVCTFSAYERAFEGSGIHRSTVIVWDKVNFSPRWQNYHSQHEFVFFGWVDGKPHPFHGGRAQSDLWQIKRERDYDHPTQKPVALFERAINNSSRPGEAVLDLFAGSGTVFIAAERTGRRALGVELDPRFAEVCLRRFTELTGMDPEKIAEGVAVTDAGTPVPAAKSVFPDPSRVPNEKLPVGTCQRRNRSREIDSLRVDRRLNRFSDKGGRSASLETHEGSWLSDPIGV